MKKIGLLFAFIALCVSAMAQDVVYDQTNQTGVRTVVCSGINLGVSDGMDVYIALAGFQYKSTVKYSLAVTIGSGHEVEVPERSKCLLTLNNSKVIELPTVAGGASVLQAIDVELSDVYQTFRRFAYYDIKAKNLKKVGKEGIMQLDLQLLPADYAMGFNQDELGAMLTGSYALLENMLKK